MEEDKYYVPEISEFHVGFEYEQISSLGETWCEMISTTAEDLDVLTTEIELGYVRVPYLTAEDIQIEGYEMLFEISPSGDTYFKKDKVTIWCDFNRHMVRVHYNDDGNNIVLFQSLGDSDIKNKSEFKKILKMIGV
jgi:hypothetical protein